ncbi:transcriptional regulator [Microbulbifer sp. TRSA002]|uniref:transcriptional regulator n=1 Tax=unclassified Microbulbifer TaxID=2619833 RepID=UPI0040397428
MMQETTDSALDIAIKLVGSQANLARAIGVTPVFVSQMRNGLKAIPPKLCSKIELATQRRVSRACLRPDVFGPLDDQIGGQAMPEVRQAS